MRRVNTTSVYTAAGVFPMLPPRLSNDLTSLHEGEERLAVVVEMDIAGRARSPAPQLYRAAVRNHAKLDYDASRPGSTAGAGAGRAWPRMRRCRPSCGCTTRRRARLRQLAPSARRAERRHLAGPAGVRRRRLVDLRADRKNRAKDLIADLMIATNGVTARFLARARPAVAAPGAAATAALGPAGQAGRAARRQPAGRARRAGARPLPDRAPPGRPGRLRGPVAGGGQAARFGRLCGCRRRTRRRPATSGWPSTTTRTRPRRTAASSTS